MFVESGFSRICEEFSRICVESGFSRISSGKSEMRTARLDSMRRPFEDLFDRADVAAITRRTDADTNAFAGNGEGNGDHPAGVTGDAVASRVQVIDDDVVST
jgi:hypothetical protein